MSDRDEARPLTEHERRAESLRVIAARHPEWRVETAASGLLFATRRDDPDVTVSGEDALDLHDEIVRWTWRNAPPEQ
jgi:hypothetical protein